MNHLLSTLDLNNSIIFVPVFTSQTRRQYRAGGSRRRDGGEWRERGLGVARADGGVDNGLCGRVLCDQAVENL